MSFPQIAFAATVALSIVGTYIAVTPPNEPDDNKEAYEPSDDTIQRFGLTGRHSSKLCIAPLVLAALHICLLALSYSSPDDKLPAWLLGYGDENGLNKDLITWSFATTIPLLLILFVGIPLRLISYTSLGTDFTFTLTRPDTLSTKGIYRYVQHPSYAGLFVLLLSQAALLARVDGVAACCPFPPSWYPFVRIVGIFVVFPAMVAILASAVWTRVKEEERMLREFFGRDWEVWHAETPRFVPFVEKTPLWSRFKA